jgi:hypothetical protein
MRWADGWYKVGASPCLIDTIIMIILTLSQGKKLPESGRRKLVGFEGRVEGKYTVSVTSMARG